MAALNGRRGYRTAILVVLLTELWWSPDVNKTCVGLFAGTEKKNALVFTCDI